MFLIVLFPDFLQVLLESPSYAFFSGGALISRPTPTWSEWIQTWPLCVAIQLTGKTEFGLFWHGYSGACANLQGHYWSSHPS